MFVSLIYFYLRGIFIAEESNDLVHNLSPEKETAHLILALCLSIYLLIAIYSCVYASRRLDRMRMSKTIRADFLRKHFYYVAVFASVWGCYLANAYFDLFYPYT